MSEKEPIVEKEDVVLVNDFLQRRNITHIIYDLDGTLIDTDTQFRVRRQEVLNFIFEQQSGLDQEKIIQNYDWINKYAFFKRSVNPSRWNLVLSMLHQYHPEINTDLFNQALSMFYKLYFETAAPHPGAELLLDTTQRSSAIQSLNTHRNYDWAQRSLIHLGWRGYFYMINIVPEDSFKDQYSWKSLTHKLHADPAKTLVIGDSVPGDIWGSYHAGIKNLVWVHLDNGWSLYRQGKDELPPGTIVVPQAVEWLNLLRQGKI